MTRPRLVLAPAAFAAPVPPLATVTGVGILDFANALFICFYYHHSNEAPALITTPFAVAVSGANRSCMVPLADGRIKPSRIITFPAVVDIDAVETVPASVVD